MITVTAISKFLLAVGLLCLVCSSIYSALAVVAALRFARRKRLFVEPASSSTPELSLLKPLHGKESGLEARLEAFFEQDYANYEILFCARHNNDSGLQAARRVAQNYPHVPVQFLATGEPTHTNAKVSSLELMSSAARSNILVISDSDVRVDGNYLREVTAPFADVRVGLVTCLYRGVADGKSVWSRLEATAMSVEMAAGVLVAESIEGMQFALGPTMAVRRSCVEEIGGFGILGRYCADDFVLGNRIAAHGHQIILSHHVIDHVVLNESFLQSIKHQVRWMKSTRFSRPRGHLGTALTFSVPFGILAAAASVGVGMPRLGFAALAWSVATRMMLAAVVGGVVVQEGNLRRTLLLYPFRDLMGFGFWAASYVSNRILWRGEIFELLRHGIMRRYAPKTVSARMGKETLLPPRP